MLLVLYMHIYKHMQMQSIHLPRSKIFLNPKPSDLHPFFIVGRPLLELDLPCVKEHAPDLSTVPCSESSTWTCQGTTEISGVQLYQRPQPHDWTVISAVAG